MLPRLHLILKANQSKKTEQQAQCQSRRTSARILDNIKKRDKVAILMYYYAEAIATIATSFFVYFITVEYKQI